MECFMPLSDLFSSSLLNEQYVFFDVETTGLSPLEKDRVIEIAMVKTKNGSIVDKLEYMFNPDRGIPESASKVNNISDEMVKDAPKFSYDIAKEILNFIKDHILVAHSAAFDLGFLAYEIGRTTLWFEKWSAIDTLKLARAIHPNLQKHRLSSLMEYYSIEPKGAFHRAINDTIGLQKLFFAMLNEASISTKSIEYLVKNYGFKAKVMPRDIPAFIREPLICQDEIQTKYKNRNNDILNLNLKLLSPVWNDNHWYILAKNLNNNEIYTLLPSSFIDKS
jgi:DNA polymerase III epsilon subunit family exonuclease